MVQVEVKCEDEKVAAMVRGLGVAVAGFTAVSGASDWSVIQTGKLALQFPDESRAKEFCHAIRKYLPAILAEVVEAKPTTA